jgi:hypothetical protein
VVAGGGALCQNPDSSPVLDADGLPIVQSFVCTPDCQNDISGTFNMGGIAGPVQHMTNSCPNPDQNNHPNTCDAPTTGTGGTGGSDPTGTAGTGGSDPTGAGGTGGTTDPTGTAGTGGTDPTGTGGTTGAGGQGGSSDPTGTGGTGGTTGTGGTGGDECKGKVFICHHTSSKKFPRLTIWVSCHAVQAHLTEHEGDTLGPCDFSCHQ